MLLDEEITRYIWKKTKSRQFNKEFSGFAGVRIIDPYGCATHVVSRIRDRIGVYFHYGEASTDRQATGRHEFDPGENITAPADWLGHQICRLIPTIQSSGLS